MRVKIKTSMCVMPDWKVFEAGETYDVNAATTGQWIASGLAEAVDSLPAASAPDAPPADDVNTKRKRK